MDLYFTRHGRTEWNKELRFQGSNGDSPLLPESYEEITLLGQRIKEIPFQKIYTSPQLRAKTTAELINQQLANPVEIIETDALKEMNLGDLEGQMIPEMQKIYPQQLDCLRAFPEKYDPSAYKGETFSQVVRRVENFVVNVIAETSVDAPILFVSHGATLTAAINAMAGEKLADLRKRGGINNNSLSQLVTENKQLPFHLVTYNDVSFLKEERVHASGDELI